MIKLIRALICDENASAGEFALVLPLAMLFFFGIIDSGRYLWEVNQAEKATQKGARFAVATDMVPSGLADYSFAISSAIPQGTVVPKTAFSRITCTSDGTTATCACPSGAPCAFGTAANTASFNRIVTRMQTMLGRITRQNVVIDYTWSGLGFSGDPNGPDVSPMVTIRLNNVQFNPILTTAFGGTVKLPGASYSLTAEDSLGQVSN